METQDGDPAREPGKQGIRGKNRGLTMQTVRRFRKEGTFDSGTRQSGSTREEPFLYDQKPSPSPTVPPGETVHRPVPRSSSTVTATTVSGLSSPFITPTSTNNHLLVPPKNGLGLTLVHDTARSTADAIFVHGLGGTSRNTWCWNHDAEMFWPAWLQHEVGLSQFRVFTYGYDANFRGGDASLSILDFAEGLLAGMSGYGRGGSGKRLLGDRPIIFLAHSMGGLVVKKAYIIGRIDELYSQMIAHVRCIVFFSTPHKGSSLAETLNNILSVMVGLSKKIYVSELESNSTSIRDTNRYFEAICSPLRLVSMFETISTRVAPGVKRTIVGEETGVLGYEQEMRLPMHADHHNVCKFRSRADENYVVVRNLLQLIARDLKDEGISLAAPTARSGASKLLETILGIQGHPREDLEMYRSHALKESCEWPRSRAFFAEWLSASTDQTRLLCLTGSPGTGKSTLAAMTADHLQKTFSVQSCQYHFFMGSQPAKKSIAYCLRSLAFQLASTHAAFRERLLQMPPDVRDTLVSGKSETIWATVFEGILFQMDFGQTLHWVIDAVDEAETPHLLLRLLSQMQPRTSIKVMLLSRPTKDIASIHTPQSTVFQHQSISTDDTLDDIRTYVRFAVGDVFPSDEHLQQNVTEQIVSKAEGSFLWTRLALDALRDNWHTYDDIQNAMSSIPKDMESLYHTMLRKIDEQDAQRREMARRILTWAACSCRPLTIAELQVALEPDFGRFASLGDTIIQICGNFVRHDGDTISLIHSTARQFLVTPVEGEPEFVPFYAGHESLASVCLRYLSNDRLRRILSMVPERRLAGQTDRLGPVYERHLFFKYAMDNWAYHVQNAPVNSPSLLAHLRIFMGRHILSWVQAVALSGNLQAVPQAARHINTFVKRRRSWLPPSPGGGDSLDTDVTFLERWSVDLIRLVGKFGMNLAQSPSSVLKVVPPLCPRDSVISEIYHCQKQNPLLRVHGVLLSKGWGDSLARFSVGQDEAPSMVRCAGAYFLVATASPSGTVIIYSSETCEELRRLSHSAWVLIMEPNEAGTKVVSYSELAMRVWDITTGLQLYYIEQDSRLRAMSIRFGESDTGLMVAYSDSSVRTYNLQTSSESGRFLACEEGEDRTRGWPRLVAISPDRTQVAVAHPGRPVLVWDLLGPPDQDPPRRCLRAADEAQRYRQDPTRSHVLVPAEVVVWHPDGDSLYILYFDTVLVHWRHIEDEQSEHRDTGARQMKISNDGSLLLTSDNSGSFSVWALPNFNLIYKLHSENLIRDLAFSPDSRRIYDVRDSIGSIWEPCALVRAGNLDRQDSDRLLVPKPVVAQDECGSQVTALVCDGRGEFFCCGRNDGSVTIHEMGDGKRSRKVCNHDTDAEVSSLAWSPSGKYLVSADDYGQIIAKRLKLKEDGKWAVFPVFETSIDEELIQLLFNPDESLLLIDTVVETQFWDLKTKRLLCKRQKDRVRRGGRWINHPFNKELLVWLLNIGRVLVYKWPDAESEASDWGLADFESDEKVDEGKTVVVSVRREVADSEEVVQDLILTDDRRFLVGGTVQGYSQYMQLYVLLAGDLKNNDGEGQDDVVEFGRRRLSELELPFGIRRFLGCFRDNCVAWIDHQDWLCTGDVDWENKGIAKKKVRRHFFLPRDWLNNSYDTINLVALTKQGILLVPRNGEVAIVRYAKGL